MIKKCTNKSEIIFILNNIRLEDKNELIALYGENWFEKTVEDMKEADVLIMYGHDDFDNVIPIAMGGFEISDKDSLSAAIWLLSSYYISKNKSVFWKDIQNLVKQSEVKYNVLYNFIYKSNYKAKTWLKKLGFIFDEENHFGVNTKEGFEFFYKITKKGR